MMIRKMKFTVQTEMRSKLFRPLQLYLANCIICHVELRWFFIGEKFLAYWAGYCIIERRFWGSFVMKLIFLYMKKNIKENRTGCGFRETVIQKGKISYYIQKAHSYNV